LTHCVFRTQQERHMRVGFSHVTTAKTLQAVTGLLKAK